MHNVQPRPFFTLQNWLLTASRRANQGDSISPTLMVSLPQRELLTTARRGKNDEVQNSFHFSCNGKNLGHLTHFGKRFDFTVGCSFSFELRFETYLEILELSTKVLS